MSAPEEVPHMDVDLLKGSDRPSGAAYSLRRKRG